MTRNYSRVWLGIKVRRDYQKISLTNAIKSLNLNGNRDCNLSKGLIIGYYIPRDAKLDGL